MKVIDIIKSKIVWILSIIFLTIGFCILGWIAYPKAFRVILPLTIVFSTTSIFISIKITYQKEKKFFNALDTFLTQHYQRDLLNYLIKASPDKEYKYIVKTFDEICEREKNEKDKLIAANENYSNYIESWVHEIKTPLALMQLVLDNHENEISTTVKEKLIKSRRSMENQVEQVLYYSKTQVTHKDFIFKKFTLESLCKEAIKSKAEVLLEAGFSIELPSMPQVIVTDKKCFKFILGQIIDNSIKYFIALSKAKSNTNLAGKLQFKSTIEKSKIVLSIRDNGPGVQNSQLPFIFDKGFVGRTGRLNEKSTGMGLYICKSLCEELGIELEAKNIYEKGLMIIFKFPIVQ
ncbi:ATP-binding protein [Clostridium sp. KNHs214]|uniref:sensor histidine kinase n=1 Tax=Clostridium sp. KNHs214 TaxID=1540257 RepID=UPI0005526D81|nr:ATP-binding protein [Clostridium sp. KNHs214]